MTIQSRHRLRALAVATLIALGSTILGLLLTIVFPDFGMPQHFSGILYIPPQAFLVVLLAPTTFILSCVASLSILNQSRRAGRPSWAGVFSVILLLLILGPAYLICSFGVRWSVFPHPPVIPTFQDPGWQTGDWWALAGGSAALMALTAVCTLVYASRAIPPNRLLQNQDSPDRPN